MESNAFNYVVVRKGKEKVYDGAFDEGAIVRIISELEENQYYHMLKIGGSEGFKGNLFFSRDSGTGKEFRDGTVTSNSFNIFAGAEMKGLLKVLVLEAIKDE